MNERMNLTVKGDVQGVGFRIEVQKAAVKFRVVGNVQNQEDGTVKVVCEGKKEALYQFIKAITVRKGRIFVDDILKTPGKATGDFNRFRIERGPLSPEALEIIERLDTGLEMTEAMRRELSSGQKSMHRDLSGGQKRMHRDLSRGQRETTNAVRSMDTHVKRMDCNMGGRFDRLDRKYGEFGNTMKGMAGDVKASRKGMDGMAKDIRVIRKGATCGRK